MLNDLTKCMRSWSLVDFCRNERGTTAIIFTFTLIPMVLSVGVAVDFARARAAKTELQAAVDSAALAGASRKVRNQNSNSNEGRRSIALSILSANGGDVSHVDAITPHVSFGQDSINVSATAVVPTTFASMIMPEIAIAATATARFGRSGPLCLLALNARADDTFKAWGTADLIAPECAVQSHSVSPVGMVTGGSATATSAYFCSAGGHSGSAFSPGVENNCSPASDPYAGTFAYSNLVAGGIDVAVTCPNTRGLRVRNDTTYDAGSPTSVMTFCGGMVVQSGATVTFAPGVYKFYTQLLISSGATVIADGATFYFADISTGVGAADGHLDVVGGANLDLKAPTTGPFAGIAIVQPTVSNYTGGTTPALTHTIIGGGRINIVGTIYTPQAKVRVTGNGTINDTSNYFSIIADMVELEGNGQLYINAGSDYVTSGLPSMPLAGGYGGSLMN